MKKNYITFLFLISILNIGYADSQTTELNIFGCTWEIPNSMTIEENEEIGKIVIVTDISGSALNRQKKLSTSEKELAIKAITINKNKDDLTKFLDSSQVTKKIIGLYNSNFETYSLSSDKDSTIKGVGMVLYEGKELFALVMGFTETQRFELTKKCY